MALYNGSEKVSSQISTTQYADVTDLMKYMTIEVGDIGQVMLPLNENENKRRYLNGQIILQEQFKKFTEKLKKAVSLYPTLACTESQWQALRKADPDDQCAKFVIDNVNGTIRLPRVKYLVGNLNLYRFAEGMPNRRLVKVYKSGNNWYNWYSDGWIEQGGYFGATGSDVNTVVKLHKTMKDNKYDLHINMQWTGTGAASWQYLCGHNMTTTQFECTCQSSTYHNWVVRGYTSAIPDSTQQYSNSIESQFESPYYIQVSTGVDYEVDVTNKITNNNNPYAFGMFQRSVSKLKNLSWLKSDGTYYDGTVYNDYYNWILRNYNTEEDGIEVGILNLCYRWVRDTDAGYHVWTPKRKLKVGDTVYGYLTSHPAGYVTSVTDDNHVSFFDRRANTTMNLVYDSEDMGNASLTDYMFVLDIANKTFRLPLLVGDEMVPAYGQDVTPGFPILRSDTVYQYIAPYNGILNIQVDRENSAGNTPNVIINDISYQYSPFWVTNFCNFTIPLRRGDRVLLKSDIAADNFACGVQRFTKCTNITPLYFYVGEAEQNLDLINVGNMAENFATISGKLNEIGTSAEYMSTVETQVNEMSTVVNTFDTKMASVDEHVAELTTTVEGMADVQTQMSEIATQMEEVTANIETQQAEMTTKLNEVNEIAENINTFTKRYVIDTFHDGLNWYTLYNDGWCEQGGLNSTTGTGTIATVTLLKPYRDTNYFVARTNLNGTGNGPYANYTGGIQDRTETGFTFIVDTAGTYCNGTLWEAKGYIALPTEQEPTDTPTEE